MEANDFITKLKADGSGNDIHDLEKVYSGYKELLGKVPSKDKGPFSLNVLCILCRNIDKVPSWRDKIDGKALLNLSIDCVRQTRGLDNPERIKVLACVYHVHKFIVREPSQPPPELVLKLSYMPFEYEQDNLLTNYCKTYWNLLADRLMFIEKFKSGRRAIIKLLPKLTEDVQKVISMYDSVQFCNTILVFLMKKLHFLYSTEHSKDLNVAFGAIFESLSLKKDVKAFKKLSEKEILELYVKLNDCFYVVAENSTRFNFKESVLTVVVRTCIPFIGHAAELFHCLQTFYLNAFCCILTENDNSTFNETVLNSLITSCETTERLGYTKTMKATYPYINQLLRVYIEYSLVKTNMTEDSQETCLKLIILLLDKLKDTEQLLKCDNCKIKSGLHDALRLSFLAKNFVSACLNNKLDVTIILQPYLMIIQKQHSILTELCRLGCSNHDKCLRKLQTDIHNTAILLNKAEHYDWAIRLFDLYLTHEFLHFKTSQDLKNISRALYNKSICELDSKMYEKALVDGFLSLIFAQPEGLSSEKYMSLVMNVKEKALKGGEDGGEGLQMMTVFDACGVAVERKFYGNLKPFFCNLEFGTLLQHEFNMYARLWPSLSPVAGVWRALHYLATGRRHAWMCAQPPTLDILCSVILQTPTYVRTIHNPHLAAILSSLLDMPESSILDNAAQKTTSILDNTTTRDTNCILDNTTTRDTNCILDNKCNRGTKSSILDNYSNVKGPILDMSSNDVKTRVTVATMLFLKAEMDLADAAVKYEWKIKDQSIDPELVPRCRTLAHEHAALRPALQAEALWSELLPRLDDGERLFCIQSIDPELVPRCRTLAHEHAALRPALQAEALWSELLPRLDDGERLFCIQSIDPELVPRCRTLAHEHAALRPALQAEALWSELLPRLDDGERLFCIQSIDPELVPRCRTLAHEHAALRPALQAEALWSELLPRLDDGERLFCIQSIDPELVPRCRTLAHEHAALRPALQAEALWSELLPRLDDVPVEFLGAPLQVLRAVLQQLLHVRRATPALQLAHVVLRVARRRADRAAYVEAAGIIMSHAHKQTEQLRRILTLAAEWAGRMLEDDATMEPALVFMCDAAIFYHNTKQLATSAKLIRIVQARLLSGDAEAAPLAAGRLLDAQALGGDLGAGVNAQRHYLTVGNNETTWCLRQHRSLLLKQRVSAASRASVSRARALRLTRRARAGAAAALGAAAAHARVSLCALAMDPSRCEARETIEQHLKRIVGLQTDECDPRKPPQAEAKDTNLFTPQPKIDIMRDAQIPKKHSASPTIPIEYVAAYKNPDFFDHDSKCQCYACENPSTFILASLLLGMEASVYFRAKEFDVAKNYFDGVLGSFCIVESKLKASVKKLRERFEKYIVDIIEKLYEKELLNVELEVLIEAAYFELSQKNYSKSDDYIYVRIHEILQAADVDAYTKNEIMNLMTASEVLRKADKITDRIPDIEIEFENLKLTPTKEILKTPEGKATKPPIINKVVVGKEELPDLKYKIPILNFDEPEEQIVPKKKTNFKIPIPITARPVLETITRPRAKVNILLTQPSEEALDVAMTPQTDKSKVEFFTPSESPDQFFTPQTSVKTYAKKSLRQNIVKNLELEFSSKENSKTNQNDAKENEKELKENAKPKLKHLKTEAAKLADSELKENSKPNSKPQSKVESAKSVLEKRGRVETGSLRSLKDRRLVRSTSPGKLPKEENPKTRLRRPAVRVERDDKK